MSTTLVYGGGPTTITLNDSMTWPDEYLWHAVEQKKTYGLTGACLVESALKLSGRPITLTGDDTSGWLARSVVDALEVAKRIAGQQFTLAYRGVSHAVMFDHETGAMDARPVIDFSDPGSSDFYVVTLRFIKVA